MKKKVLVLIGGSFLVASGATCEAPSPIEVATIQNAPIPEKAELSKPALQSVTPNCSIPAGTVIDLGSTGTVNWVLSRMAIGNIRGLLETAAKCDIGSSEDAAKYNYLVLTAIAERIAAAVAYKISCNPSWDAWRDVCDRELLDKLSLLTLTTTKCSALSALTNCSLFGHTNDLSHLTTKDSITSKSHFYTALYAMSRDSKLKLRDLIKQRLKTAENLHEVALEAVTLVRDLWETLAKSKDCSATLRDVIDQIQDKKDGKFKDAIEKYAKVIFEKYDLQMPAELGHKPGEADAISSALTVPVVTT